jgi:hypoxanthine-guanine phosphoribosyltransferase
MHTKRCAVQAATRDDGTSAVKRTVTHDLKRMIVLQGATVFFGNLSREIVADVILFGPDVDRYGAALEAGTIVIANMQITEDEQYRLTDETQDQRFRRHAV